MVDATWLAERFGLDGSVALVTGGSSGIGRSIAEALALAGAQVMIAARTEADTDTAVAQIRARGGLAHGIVADLSTQAGANGLADAAGPVDVLVNCAAINPRPPLDELDEATWHQTLATNLDAPFILGQRLAPRMVSQGFGRIIHVSSQQASRAFGNSGVYGVSKAAVEGLVRSQAEA